MYRFGKKSLNKLSQCDEKLQELAHLALLYSKIDFGISESYRTIRQQKRLYSFGRYYPNENLEIVTYSDGVRKKSKHNLTPSKAFHIFAIVDGKITDDIESYKEIYKAFEKAGKELDIKFSWGGKKKFKDYTHYEVK